MESATFETVGWINWNSNTGLPIYSKRHILNSDGDKTLCGQSITREMDTDDGAGCHDDCKRCRSAARKIEG